MLARHNFEARAEVTFGAGSALPNDLQSGLADSAASSAAAARAQKLLSMSMNALESLRSPIDKEAGMSAGKKKWYRAFKRHIIRQQVEVNRVRLESSPAYHALLAEQVRERNRARGALFPRDARRPPGFPKTFRRGEKLHAGRDATSRSAARARQI